MLKSVWLSLALFAGLMSQAFAQQAGDRVATITAATLHSGAETVGTIPKGNILTVRKVDGPLSLVKWSGRQTVDGWVNQSEVVPLERALEVFSADLKREPTAATFVARGTILNCARPIRQSHCRLHRSSASRSEGYHGLQPSRPRVGESEGVQQGDRRL